ncbi:MAG: hypothetical protein ACJ76Y_30220 [Thermoanaerobaculia bacterium]
MNPNAVAELVAEGGAGSGTLDELAARLPRTAWVMVPAASPRK